MAHTLKPFIQQKQPVKKVSHKDNKNDESITCVVEETFSFQRHIDEGLGVYQQRSGTKNMEL